MKFIRSAVFHLPGYLALWTIRAESAWGEAHTSVWSVQVGERQLSENTAPAQLLLSLVLLIVFILPLNISLLLLILLLFLLLGHSSPSSFPLLLIFTLLIALLPSSSPPGGFGSFAFHTSVIFLIILITVSGPGLLLPSSSPRCVVLILLFLLLVTGLFGSTLRPGSSVFTSLPGFIWDTHVFLDKQLKLSSSDKMIYLHYLHTHQSNNCDKLSKLWQMKIVSENSPSLPLSNTASTSIPTGTSRQKHTRSDVKTQIGLFLSISVIKQLKI